MLHDLAYAARRRNGMVASTTSCDNLSSSMVTVHHSYLTALPRHPSSNKGVLLLREVSMQGREREEKETEGCERGTKGGDRKGTKLGKERGNRKGERRRGEGEREE